MTRLLNGCIKLAWVLVCLLVLDRVIPARQTFVTFEYEAFSAGPMVNSGATVINGNGESGGTVGQIVFERGENGSKTCSAGGGCQIAWQLQQNIDFTDGATVVRVGIQDVSTSTGLEDGTYDVSADLSPGVETMNSNRMIFYTMESGTKTITEGDIVAVVAEMINVGATNSFSFGRAEKWDFVMGLPYGTADTGTLARGSSPGQVFIRFDDGTLGWFLGLNPARNVAGSISGNSINTGTTPDEYCGSFKFPASMTIDGYWQWVDNMTTTDPAEMSIYADPLGSPTLVWGPVTLDADQVISNTAGLVGRMGADLVVDTTTTYAFCFRPTSANSITYDYYVLPSEADTEMKEANFFIDPKLLSRVDNTGAFTEVDPLNLPVVMVHVKGFIEEEYGQGVPVPTILSWLLPKRPNWPRWLSTDTSDRGGSTGRRY